MAHDRPHSLRFFILLILAAAIAVARWGMYAKSYDAVTGLFGVAITPQWLAAAADCSPKVLRAKAKSKARAKAKKKQKKPSNGRRQR